jgi:hypothetical protein
MHYPLRNEREWGRREPMGDDWNYWDLVSPEDQMALTPVDVDIDAIGDLAKVIQNELDLNLRPETQKIIDEHHTGTALTGPWQSSVYMEVSADYYATANLAITALKSYVDATTTLLGAVDAVAKMYRDADAMVNANVDQVVKAFDDSWAAIQKQQADAAAAAQTGFRHPGFQPV